MHYLYTDGSHANDLNIAGIGGYLLDSNNKELWQFSNPLYYDQAHHELKALDYALVRCIDSGIKELTCYTDSLNIVRDITNKKVNHHSKYYGKIFDEVLKLTQKFHTIDFQFIPRENNKKANNLARKVLTNMTSKQSRLEIFQSQNLNAIYFKSPKLFCSEQYFDKKKTTNIKNNIESYYVFDLYRDSLFHTLDVYSIKHSKTKPEKLHSYSVTDILSQYISAINQTLGQSDFSTIGIMLCPANNDIDLMLRGMKSCDKQYHYELGKLHKTLEKFKRVLIDSDTSVYQAVFNKDNYI